MPSDAPVIVGLYRADHVSGINATAARMARLPAPARPWLPLLVGPDLDAARVEGFGPLDFHVASWPAGASPVEQVRAVLASLRRLKASVVVPNDLPHGFIAAGLDAHRGLRCAAWLHADDLTGDDLTERCGPLADAWRAVSPAIARRAGATGALAHAPVADPLPCPVDVPERRVPPPSLAGPLRLLYAGRLERFQKRVLDLAPLVDALAALRVDFHLRIAGRGPAEADLRARLASHVRAGRVSFLGSVPTDQMPSLYAWCDALILVSAYEGTPVVGMEALAAGRAILSTRGIGGLADPVERTGSGLLVEIGDMAALATAIASLDRHALGAMGRAGHALARERYSLAALAPACDAWMREAAAQPARVDPRDAGSILAQWDRILGALEAIGPCDPIDLRSFATSWLGDLGRPELAGALATWLPSREGPRERLLRDAVRVLAARGLAPVALYGAGLHTRRLAAAIASLDPIACIIDDRAGQGGIPDTIAGRPVIAPSDAQPRDLRSILISSDEHEQAMLERARSWAGPIPVVPLYNVRPTLGLAPRVASQPRESLSRPAHATRRAG